MKKLIIAIVLCLVLVGLTVSPVMAAKPQPFFTARITSDGFTIPGAVEGNFVLKIDGVPIPTRHMLGLADAKTNLVLDGNYPFYLQADASQQAALTAYFGAKGWPDNYLAQIAGEIAGTSPFFYLNASSGVYTLVDGFTLAVFSASVPLSIDNDYPVGKYVYTGNLGALPLSVTLKVIR